MYIQSSLSGEGKMVKAIYAKPRTKRRAGIKNRQYDPVFNEMIYVGQIIL